MDSGATALMVAARQGREAVAGMPSWPGLGEAQKRVLAILSVFLKPWECQGLQEIQEIPVPSSF